MTREDFVVRWRTRLSERARIGALVDGARVCEDVLQDFEAVTRAEDDAELGLSEAAAEWGYSSDYLRRLHRKGQLAAYRKGRSLFFRSGDYRGSQRYPSSHPTIRARMLDGSSGSAGKSDNGESARAISTCRDATGLLPPLVRSRTE